MDLASTLSIECDTERWELVDQQDQGIGPLPFKDSRAICFVQVPPPSNSTIATTATSSPDASSSLLLFNLGCNVFSLFLHPESHSHPDSAIEPQASNDGAQSQDGVSPADRPPDAADKLLEDEDASASPKEMSTESPDTENCSTSEAQTPRKPTKPRKSRLIMFPTFISGLDFNPSAAPGMPDLAITLLRGDIILVRLSEIMKFFSNKGSVSMTGGSDPKSFSVTEYGHTFLVHNQEGSELGRTTSCLWLQRPNFQSKAAVLATTHSTGYLALVNAEAQVLTFIPSTSIPANSTSACFSASKTDGGPDNALVSHFYVSKAALTAVALTPEEADIPSFCPPAADPKNLAGKLMGDISSQQASSGHPSFGNSKRRNGSHSRSSSNHSRQASQDSLARFNLHETGTDSALLAIASRDGYVNFIDGATLTKVGSWRTYYGAPLSLSWSPDGKFLAVGSEDDQLSIVQVTVANDQSDARSKPTLSAFTVAWGQGHTSYVSAVCFSPRLSGTGTSYLVATGGQDTAVALWSFTAEDLDSTSQTSPEHPASTNPISKSGNSICICPWGILPGAHREPISTVGFIKYIRETVSDSANGTAEENYRLISGCHGSILKMWKRETFSDS